MNFNNFSENKLFLEKKNSQLSLIELYQKIQILKELESITINKYNQINFKTPLYKNIYISKLYHKIYDLINDTYNWIIYIEE
jgi:hypothetical protein